MCLLESRPCAYDCSTLWTHPHLGDVLSSTLVVEGRWFPEPLPLTGGAQRLRLDSGPVVAICTGLGSRYCINHIPALPAAAVQWPSLNDNPVYYIITLIVINNRRTKTERYHSCTRAYVWNICTYCMWNMYRSWLPDYVWRFTLNVGQSVCLHDSATKISVWWLVFLKFCTNFPFSYQQVKLFGKGIRNIYVQRALPQMFDSWSIS